MTFLNRRLFDNVSVFVDSLSGANRVAFDVAKPNGVLTLGISGNISANNIKVGTGSPEGSIDGIKGDIYQRTDGSIGTTLYIKESGSGNTGWSALGAPSTGSLSGGISGYSAFWSSSNSISASNSIIDSSALLIVPQNQKDVFIGNNSKFHASTGVFTIGTTASTINDALEVNGTTRSKRFYSSISSAGLPTPQLYLDNTNSTSALEVRAMGNTNGGVTDWEQSIILEASTGGASGGLVFSAYTGDIKFQTNARQTAMNLKESGNLILGGDTTDDKGHKFQINGTTLSASSRPLNQNFDSFIIRDGALANDGHERLTGSRILYESTDFQDPGNVGPWRAAIGFEIEDPGVFTTSRLTLYTQNDWEEPLIPGIAVVGGETGDSGYIFVKTQEALPGNHGETVQVSGGILTSEEVCSRQSLISSGSNPTVQLKRVDNNDFFSEDLRAEFGYSNGTFGGLMPMSGARIMTYTDVPIIIKTNFGGTPAGNSAIFNTTGNLLLKTAIDNNADTLQVSGSAGISGNLTSFNIRRGIGAPEGVAVGNVGDIYQRVDGGIGTTLYIKESGTGNTGWTVVSAAGSADLSPYTLRSETISTSSNIVSVVAAVSAGLHGTKTSNVTTAAISAGLNTRVTTIEGNYTRRASSDNSVYSRDLRALNLAPSGVGNAGLYVDFKENATDGLSDGGVYHGVLTFRPYGTAADFSGGPASQIGNTFNGNLWVRNSTSPATWGAWSQLGYRSETVAASSNIMATVAAVSAGLVLSGGIPGRAAIWSATDDISASSQIRETSNSVLIGTTTDSGTGKLQVNGYGRFVTTGNEGALIGTWSEVDSRYAVFQNSALPLIPSNFALNQLNNGETTINSAAGQQLRINIGNSPAVVIPANKNVLIGTTTDNLSGVLQVNGSGVFTGKLFVNTAGATTVQEAFRISSGLGAVNAGTSIDWWHTVGAANSAAYARVAGVTDSGGSGGLLAFYTTPAFGTPTSERVRINQNGYLLVNTVNSVGAYVAQINGQSYYAGTINVGTAQTTANAGINIYGQGQDGNRVTVNLASSGSPVVNSGLITGYDYSVAGGSGATQCGFRWSHGPNSYHTNLQAYVYNGGASTFDAQQWTPTNVLIRVNDVDKVNVTTSSLSANVNINSPNIQRGSGSPEGVAVGNVGDIYQRTNGGSGTTLYIKESGTGNTGWTAVAPGSSGGSSLSGGIVSRAAIWSSTNNISASSLLYEVSTNSLGSSLTVGTTSNLMSAGVSINTDLYAYNIEANNSQSIKDVKFRSIPHIAAASSAKSLAGVNWTPRTAIASSHWRSVCWSPELRLFVAVCWTGSSGNRVMTSPDGITWTARATPADNQWYSVCWSPELRLFVAVAATGTNNRVMTSPDGITWTAQNAAAENSWVSVCWSSELRLFVAVASNGVTNSVMTSPDGANWTSRSALAAGWNCVCWSPELRLFVAVNGSISTNIAMISPDGITWTTITGANGAWASVCWASELGLFVAGTALGSYEGIMTSPDGVNWTTRYIETDNGVQSLSYAPEIQMLIGTTFGNLNNIITSSDSINWRSRRCTTSSTFGSCWSPELRTIVVVGFSNSADAVVHTSTVNSGLYTGAIELNNSSYSISTPSTGQPISGTLYFDNRNRNFVARTSGNYINNIDTGTGIIPVIRYKTLGRIILNNFAGIKGLGTVNDSLSGAGPNLAGGFGSLTVPAAYWAPGKTILARCYGQIQNTGTPTLTFRHVDNNNVGFSTGAVTMSTITGIRDYDATSEITCISITSTGANLICSGRLRYGVTSNTANTINIGDNVIKTVSLGTTATWEMTAQFSAASTSNGITAHQYTITEI